jgi:oxysterol 7-alpha-hydroxylase
MTSLNTFFGPRIQVGYPTLRDDFRLVDDTLYTGVRTNLAFQMQPHALRARDNVLKAFDTWVNVELGDGPAPDKIWSEQWGMKLNWEREKLHRHHQFSIRGRSCAHASFLYVYVIPSFFQLSQGSRCGAQGDHQRCAVDNVVRSQSYPVPKPSAEIPQ